MKVSELSMDRALLLLLAFVEKNVPYYAAQYQCMYHMGCRSVETIEKKRWEFYDESFLILQPGKKNNKRVFELRKVPELFVNYLKYDDIPESYISYQKMNYHFGKYFIYPRIFVGRKQSSLHLFRHNFAKKLVAKGFYDEEICEILGEKNQSSANSYIYSSFRTDPYDLSDLSPGNSR